MEPIGNYQEVLDYLYSMLPMFSRLGKDAIKKDLVNIRLLCEALGNPQDKFKSIHIAGTNGKGSVSHMLTAALQTVGYKTGLYTSPHLVDFRERIRIDGKLVEEEFVIDFVTNHRQLLEDIKPSFFEITVAMAFLAFAEAEVDIAIIETGLGGRLDSTNVISPLLSVITNVSYDHTDMLGKTLPEIASEKAGIIKASTPVVIGERQQEVAAVFLEKAAAENAPIVFADELWDIVQLDGNEHLAAYLAEDKREQVKYNLAADMQGDYQLHNIRTVLAAITVLQNENPPIPIPIYKAIKAFAHVGSLTGLRGRWDTLSTQPLIIADVAHNPAGLSRVMEQWQKIVATNKWIITGFVKDKDVAEALSFFPQGQNYIYTQAQIPRALPVADLMEIAQKQGLPGQACDTIAEAIQQALSEMQEDDALLICGSFFTVGEAIEALSKE